MILRLRLSLVLLTAFALVVGAMALIGRGVHAPLAVVQRVERIDQRMTDALVDLDRGLIAMRWVDVPDLFDTRGWSAPLVLQRKHRDEFFDWTVSEVDMVAGSLTPVMTLTTSTGVSLHMTDFVGRYTSGVLRLMVYVPQTGEVYEADESDPVARRIATLERGLNAVQRYFSGGTARQFIVFSQNRVTIKNINSGGEVLLDYAGLAGREPSWSLDREHILFRIMSSPGSNYPNPVFDAETGALIAEISGSSVFWCGERRVVYRQIDREGLTTIRKADLDSGEDTLLARPESPETRFQSIVPLFYDTSCDWLLLNAYAPDNVGYLLHVGTGRLIPLGGSLRAFTTRDGTLTYQVQLEDKWAQLRRIALDPDAEKSELVANFSTENELTFITWLDGWQRGVYMNRNRIVVVDPMRDTKTEWLIPGRAPAEGYFVLP